MVRFYSSIYADDELLIRQMSGGCLIQYRASANSVVAAAIDHQQKEKGADLNGSSFDQFPKFLVLSARHERQVIIQTSKLALRDRIAP